MVAYYCFIVNERMINHVCRSAGKTLPIGHMIEMLVINFSCLFLGEYIYVSRLRNTFLILPRLVSHQPCFLQACNNSSISVTMKFQVTGLGVLPLLQALFQFSSIVTPVQSQSTTCKATPNDLSWPGISQWTFLNHTLSGRLLHPLPPASACHSSYSDSNETCAEITAAWSNFTFHQNNPVSVAWNNFNNDSCLPDPSAPCSGLGYPVYVVNASSANDVKLAVDFARENNVRLNIKASGHDYLGR